ncbi:S8 family serine peptidase [Salinibacillus xinjiangensis]|uniref:S8 family serine peptidase n=1 Tax=Salinibacillus xinjiangensis TaxID=1229268 RepID=A0A6G1X6F2_9BACI|nr:S8 family serine peptidase [Salinibacillus xinjiangensis]MRG86485.1 S8 family serine peptidase [Salinibacillus xinjiangensis]
MKRFLLLLLTAGLVLSYSNFSKSNSISAEISPVLGPHLQDVLHNEQGPFEVIVTFKGDSAPTEDQVNLLEKIGIDTGLTMQSLPMAGIIATNEQVNKLAKKDEVRSIYLNRKLEYYNADATDITGVDKVRTDSDMTKENGGFPVSGDGIGVVVNDSGIDGTHPDHKYGENLVQNVTGTTNLNALAPELLPITYVENIPNTDSNSGHGTHVAGTVGGTGAASGGKYEGVAPGTDLVGYGSGAALFILDSIGGFDYAITHQQEYDIRVITNSWGSSGDFDPNNPVNIASKKAYDRGIVVLFAAGNSGPGENTHNPYAKAPWVISVAAGEKDGTLADFSSRGTKGVGGTFEMDGKEWEWKDQPTITAPGVDIISTRALAPVSSLAIDVDATGIEPAYVPYYTTMSGTSMATPHVAGIVSLMLEANPQLSPDEVKQLIQETATNMPGYESWEVGAGYVNAYSAVDAALNGNSYGETVNLLSTFNSDVETAVDRRPFTVDYNPVTLASDNQYEFEVAEGLSNIVAKVNARGIIEQTGNSINLVLISPDGTEYSSGISLLFSLYFDRTVTVNSPKPGTWKVELRGLRGDEANSTDGLALPETVNGTLAFTKINGFSGLDDIEGSPAASAIQMGVKERLFDGYSDGTFQPDQELKRSELASYLVMGAEIRQSQEEGSFSDVTGELLPFVKAVTTKGAAFRDKKQIQNGVMLPVNDSTFAPNAGIPRAELAYSLIQSLGLQEQAQGFEGELTVQYKDERVKIEDGDQVPAHLKGYVQLALDLNVLNANFDVTQGQYDLEPTVTATFDPTSKVTRGDYAVAMTRFYNAFLSN